MGKLFFWGITLLVCLNVQSIRAQTTYSVNPNPVASADFQSLQAAIDSVPGGSILMVHGGNYAGINLNKQIVIIGPGYFLGQNQETQASLFEAKVGGAYIDVGATGSYISGLVFEGTNSPVDLYGSGIIFQRNRFNSVPLNFRNCNSNTFRQNFSNINWYAWNGQNNNMVFENNIVPAIHTGNNRQLSGIFRNNVYTGTLPDNTSSHPQNSIFENNICINSLPNNNARHPVVNTNNNTVRNNIFVGTSYQNLNGINGNIEGIATNAIFSTVNAQSPDGQYQLSPTSPALGAGFGGVDCGVFGGPSPYVLSGIPFVPNIHFLNVPFTGTSGSGIDVEIKVNANQQ